MSLPGLRLRLSSLVSLSVAALTAASPPLSASTATVVNLPAQPIGGALPQVWVTDDIPQYRVAGAGSADVTIGLSNPTLCPQISTAVQGADATPGLQRRCVRVAAGRDAARVTGYTQGIPQISQRTASTIATIEDGEAFAIGGMLQRNEIRMPPPAPTKPS